MMQGKKNFSWIVVTAVMSLLLVQAFAQPNTVDVARKLKSSDSAVRKAAAKEFLESNPSKGDNSVLPIVVTMLSDPDPEVRQMGAVSAYLIAFSNASAIASLIIPFATPILICSRAVRTI